MGYFTFDVAAFRVAFPAFANATTYTDPFLQMCWDVACNYIKNNNYGYLNGDARDRALNLLTAHIAQFSTASGANLPTGTVTSSTVGSVSVAVLQPPVKNQLQFWLLSTPYGVELMALLEVKAVGGVYVGGLPERTAFRKVGGTFT